MKALIIFALSFVILSVSNTAMGAIYKCPGKSGVYIYTSTWCADGFRREGSQWIDIAAERKQRSATAEERKKRQEDEYASPDQAPKTDSQMNENTPNNTQNIASAPSPFKCDGRQHCSQMTSCEEAKFFLQNCPNVQMDGNNDGVPCEKQWCNGVMDSLAPSGRRRH